MPSVKTPNLKNAAPANAMSSTEASMEIEIATRIGFSESTRSIADDLRKRWFRGDLDAESVAVVARFHLRTGRLATLLRACERSVARSKRVPWRELVAAVVACGAVPTNAEAEAIFTGSTEQGAANELSHAPTPVYWGSAFAAKREELRNVNREELDEKRAQLWDAIRFMRASRLFEQEAQALAELRELFPDDPEFVAQINSLQERWAREVIEQARGGSSADIEDTDREDSLSLEELKIRSSISASVIENARSHPDQAVDFALLLRSMDFRAEAIEALDAAGVDFSHTALRWLRMELLLEARKFVSTLDELAQIEIVTQGDPDAAFSIAYARARAYWGLGESAMAIDLIRSLARVRPDYRAAQSLLLAWSGGDGA